MSDFANCRSCYNHLGGKYAVTYFSWLIENKFINYIEKSAFQNPHQKILLSITDQGMQYFQLLGINMKIFNVAYACLDGTEKKPHLGGKLGEAILNYLKTNKLLHCQNNSRVLTPTQEAKEFLKINNQIKEI